MFSIRLPFICTNSVSVITPWSLNCASLDGSSAMDVTESLSDRVLVVSPSLSTVSDCAWPDDSSRVDDISLQMKNGSFFRTQRSSKYSSEGY